MTATLDDITTFFLEAGVDLNAVRQRRHVRSKDFRGSIFLECSSPEEAERVSRETLVCAHNLGVFSTFGSSISKVACYFLGGWS